MTLISKEETTKGVIWSAIERFSVQGAQFILTIIIARLIDPSEFGLIAMLSIFLAIAQTFIDSGFSNALIQKQNRTQTDFSTVFYFNIAISVILYSLIYLCAPYIAHFYDEPILIAVTRWVGLSLIISAFAVVQRAKLTISLNFKTQAKATLLSVIIGGVLGIFYACKGLGVWALVSQTLATSVCNTMFLWIFAKWKPSFTYSWQSFRVLFKFGSKLLLSGLLHTIYINMYSLVIGKKYSAADVGFYNRAFTMAQFPSVNITGILTRVFYPLQCKLQNEEDMLKETFTRFLRASAFIVFPLMILLCILAKPVVLLLLTDKWLPSAELLQILCIAYMWYPVMAINNNMLNVKGHSDYFLYAEIIKKMVAIITLFATLSFGTHILCWGLVLYNIFDMIIIIYFTKKIICTGYLDQVRQLFPFVLLTAAMALVTGLSISFIDSTILKIIIGTTVGASTYFLLALLFRFKEFNYITSLLRKNRNQNV